MSDTENPGQTPSDEPAGNLPESPSGYEPTTPYAAPDPVTPDPYGVPPMAPPGSEYHAEAAAPPAFPSPYAGPQYPVAEPPSERARVAGWTWPVVSVLALLLGIGGGYLGGTLASDNNDGGVLKVERRTAQPLPSDNDSIASVAQEVLPSTVQIIAEYKGQDKGAVGSGFVFDKQGHVITNNHVVEEADADHGPIDVIDQNGDHHKATVVGRSPVYDLAVLKVEGAESLKPVAIGSADQMRVGETAVAVGSPLRYQASVTSGIISAKNRPVTTGGAGSEASYINAIQTDAAINPGNSGGPLANLQGQVIGVNSALASLGSTTSTTDEAGNIGIGFAIPMEQVQITADQILKTGKAQYPVIGVSVGDIDTEDGAKVKTIDDGTPAAKSDLKVNDVITAVDGTKVSGVIDVIVAIRSHLITDTVELSVTRGDQKLKVDVGLFGKTG